MLSEIMLERSKILTENLNGYMDANGFTQRQLAHLAGIKTTTLNNWLRGQAYPQPENLLKLAKALHCEVSDLTEVKTYQDERKRYLTVGQASVLNAYANDRTFQNICDTSVKLLREKRLSTFAVKWNEYINSPENNQSKKDNK